MAADDDSSIENKGQDDGQIQDSGDTTEDPQNDPDRVISANNTDTDTDTETATSTGRETDDTSVWQNAWQWVRDDWMLLAGAGLLVLVVVSGALLWYTTPAEAPQPADDEDAGLSPGNGNEAAAPDTVADVEEAVHEEVNTVRDRFGLSRLQHNAKMGRIAKNHSSDMAARDYVARETPDGQDVNDRYAAAGFTCKIQTEFFIYDGETTVTAVNVSTPLNATDIAETVLDKWLHDFDARETIKKPYWEQHGIGVVQENTTLYVTQDLC